MNSCVDYVIFSTLISSMARAGGSVSVSSSPTEDYFRCSLLILYVQQYSLRAYSPEVIDVDPEEHSPAPRRDRPRSTIQTHHIQERRTTKPRMATLPAPPPGDTAEVPS